MGTFLLVMLGSAAVCYAVLMGLVMLLGDGGFLVAGLLAVGAVFALFACVLTRQERIEEKLDQLLEKQELDLH